MVIEDYDWTAFGFEGADPQLERMTDALLTFMEQAGFERNYGRQRRNRHG